MSKPLPQRRTSTLRELVDGQRVVILDGWCEGAHGVVVKRIEPGERVFGSGDWYAVLLDDGGPGFDKCAVQPWHVEIEESR